MTIVIGFHVDTAADFDSCSSPTSNLTQRTAGELSVTQYYWIHGSIKFAFIIMDACSKHFHFMLGYFHMYNIIVVQVYYIFCIPMLLQGDLHTPTKVSTWDNIISGVVLK